jgi:hypothetical protein
MAPESRIVDGEHVAGEPPARSAPIQDDDAAPLAA